MDPCYRPPGAFQTVRVSCCVSFSFVCENGQMEIRTSTIDNGNPDNPDNLGKSKACLGISQKCLGISNNFRGMSNNFL